MTPVLEAFQQVRRLYVQRLRQLDDRRQPRLALSALEERDLSPVKAAARGELLLRDAGALACAAQVRGEDFVRLGQGAASSRTAYRTSTYKTSRIQYATGAVNSVSLIGQLTEEPVLRRNRAGEHECRMRIAVPRYSRTGRREPGVVYVDVTTFGLEAVDHAERLEQGSRIGLSGRLDSDDPEWSGVVIEQLDVL